MPEILICALLGAARRAALASGLSRVTRIHLLVGPESDLSGSDLSVLLRDRWRGPLFDDCDVTWEDGSVGSVSISAVEGVTVEVI